MILIWQNTTVLFARQRYDAPIINIVKLLQIGKKVIVRDFNYLESCRRLQMVTAGHLINN